jgi:hypothetical protein
VLAAALCCAACAVQRMPAGEGPPFIRAAGFVRLSDLRADAPPAWAPDGRHLAFSAGGALWTVPPDPGATPRRIAAVRGAERVAWSPDGGTVTVLAGGRLLAFATDEPSPRALAPGADVIDYAWPPPGRRLWPRGGADRGPAFLTGGTGAATLWMVRSGGPAVHIGTLPPGLEARGLLWLAGSGGLAVIAAEPGGDPDRAVFFAPVPRAPPAVRLLPSGGRAPLPSPEGRFIAYLRDAGAGQSGADESRVAVMRTDGSGRRDLTPPGRYTALAWSPEGTLLAYAAPRGDRITLAVADVLTGERLRLGDYRPETGSPDAPLALVWAPDGKRFAFGADTGVHGATGSSAGSGMGYIWLAAIARR